MKINIDLIYPIGSIYMSVINNSPEQLFGGKWQQIQDSFLLACGTNHQAGETGGTETHTHNYGIQAGGYYCETGLVENDNAGILSYNTSNTPSKTGWSSVGSMTMKMNNGVEASSKSSSATHYRSIGNTSYTNNMPPYLAVYVWKRVE